MHLVAGVTFHLFFTLRLLPAPQLHLPVANAIDHSCCFRMAVASDSFELASDQRVKA